MSFSCLANDSLQALVLPVLLPQPFTQCRIFLCQCCFTQLAGNDVVIDHDRHVVGRFPDRATAEGWYNSPEYQEILKIRLAASTGTLIMVDGIDA